MRRMFVPALVVEVLTGLALAVSPGLVAWLLLGQDLAPGGAMAARIAGVGLLGFTAACWRWPDPAGRRAFWLFQPLVAAPLAGVALFTALGGPLLWPAILYHAAAAMMLGRR